MLLMFRAGKGEPVSYKVTLVFDSVRSGLTEDEFDTLLYKNTKHAPFDWFIEEFEELEAGEPDCE